MLIVFNINDFIYKVEVWMLLRVGSPFVLILFGHFSQGGGGGGGALAGQPCTDA